MPFLDKIATPSGEIYLWHITESSQDLICLAINNSKIIIPNISSIKRKSQTLAWQICLNQNLSDYELTYTNGKPILHYPQNKNLQLSVSHNIQYACLYLNFSTPCGIDIEPISKKLARLKSKFCLLPEQQLLENYNQPLHLTYAIAWACKESLYKKHGKGYSFKNCYIVNSIHWETQTVELLLYINDSTTKEILHYTVLNNHVIAYTL